MTKLRDLPTPIKEALAVFEVLRKMNFLSDDIYAGFVASTVDSEGHRGPAVVVQLCRQGRVFNVAIPDPLLLSVGNGTVADAPADFATAWAAACELWNTATNEEMAEVFKSSAARRNAVSLMARIALEGIDLPKP